MRKKKGLFNLRLMPPLLCMFLPFYKMWAYIKGPFTQQRSPNAVTLFCHEVKDQDHRSQSP